MPVFQVDEDIENGYEDMQNEENDQQEEEEWEEDYEEARQDLANFGQGEEEQKENDDEEAGGLLEALADPYADEGIQDEDLSTTGGDSTVSHPEVKLNLEDPEV